MATDFTYGGVEYIKIYNKYLTSEEVNTLLV